MHHRATNCPGDHPRKLVRTTVSNDFAPSEEPLPPSIDGEDGVVLSEFGFDLSRDRVNAQHPVAPRASVAVHAEL